MDRSDLLPGRRETRFDELFETPPALLGGTLAGFIATALTVPIILLVDPGLFPDIIAAMYGMAGATHVGILAHLIHGSIFGFVFAVIMADPTLVRQTQSLWKMVLTGVAYGIILALVAMGIALPLYGHFVGILDVGFPLISPSLITWHALYGVVLGLLFPYFEDL